VVNQEEKKLRERTIRLGFDFDKIKQTVDKIAAQLEEDKRIRNNYVWLSVDFEKVKHRIAKITAQLDEAHRHVEKGAGKHAFSQSQSDRSDRA
jgi:predicted  nucleic acid-binding Zn-ribbon protein